MSMNTDQTIRLERDAKALYDDEVASKPGALPWDALSGHTRNIWRQRVIDDAEQAQADQPYSYTAAQIEAVQDMIQQNGDPLTELVEKLISARRAYEAICWGNINTEVLESLMGDLTDMSAAIDDFLGEVDDTLLVAEAQALIPPRDTPTRPYSGYEG